MKIVGMIPARLQSSRLPEKALIDIGGMPMVIHTCRRAQLAGSLDEVYLVTDSEVIKQAGASYGIKVIMTGSHHKTGSDRIAEAVQSVDFDIVVNIQGDEPLVNPGHIDSIVQAMLSDVSVKVSLGVTEYSRKNSQSDIKAVLDLQGDIMYCSRTDLPSDARTPVPTMMKMCFIVAFRTSFLQEYASWAPTPLEKIEYNEYLRILEHGEKIRAVNLDDAKISVDTPEDLEEVRKLMEKDQIRSKYWGS